MPMLQSLIYVIAITVSLTSDDSMALSLGNMRTQSALNERFVGEIDLNADGSEDLDALKISLASPANFAKAGVERLFFLTQLRFNPIRLPNGKSVIRVTSRNAIREPFLDFLLEVNWPKGRIAKKFTTLLDPKVFPASENFANTAPITPPKLKRPPVSAPAAAIAASAPAKTTSPVPTNTDSIQQYGPVRSGTTLSQIANAIKAKGVATNQIVMLLFRNNPQAFVKNNINRLKSGVILRIPEQNAALVRLEKTPATTNVASNEVTKKEPEPVATTTDQLRIATQPPSPTNSDLMMVQEANESNRKETEELRSKVKDLETQLVDIQQLLKLKSEQLAQAQSANAQLAVVQTETPIPKPPTVKKQPTVPIKTTPTSNTQPKPAVLPPTPPVSAPTEDWLAYLPNLPNLSSLPDVTSWLPNDISFGPILKFIEDPFYQILFGGGTLVILLAVGGVMWFNKPRAVDGETRELEDSEIFAPSSSINRFSGLEDHSLSTMTKKPDAPSDTSFITDFSPSDIEEGQQETGEVDPAAEADVYIAYGRYQQAENLITQTLVRSPERIDLKLKLLEIYHNIRNSGGFNNLAEEMSADGFADNDPQGWRRVCDLGRDLSPGHPLFGNSERVTEPRRMESSSVSQRSDMESDNFEGLDLNLDTVLSELPDMSKLSGLKSRSMETIVTTPQILNKASVPIFATKAINTPPPPINKPQPIQIQTFSFDEEDNKEDQEFEVDLDLSGLPSIGDIDLGILNFGDDTGIKTKSPKTELPAIVAKTTTPQFNNLLSEEEDIPAINLYDLGLGATDFDEIAEPEAEEHAEPDPLFEQFNSSDSFEAIETKLDLARVYMDIDPDMAKGMFEEVLKEGDETQQATARELLATIG